PLRHLPRDPGPALDRLPADPGDARVGRDRDLRRLARADRLTRRAGRALGDLRPPAHAVALDHALRRVAIGRDRVDPDHRVRALGPKYAVSTRVSELVGRGPGAADGL